MSPVPAPIRRLTGAVGAERSPMLVGLSLMLGLAVGVGYVTRKRRSAGPSATEVLTAVRRALRRAGAATGITVILHERGVLLTGQVATEAARLGAEAAVAALDGIAFVRSQLTVSPPPADLPTETVEPVAAELSVEAFVA